MRLNLSTQKFVQIEVERSHIKASQSLHTQATANQSHPHSGKSNTIDLGNNLGNELPT